MGAVDATLARIAGQRVYLDSNIFIYFLDRHPVYFDAAAALLQACAANRIFGMTGDAAVAEVMVGPYRSDDPALATRFKRFFERKDFLTIVSHDRAVFEDAALLAGRKRMKLVDALHVSTALRAGCQCFLTNDTGIRSGDSIEAIQLAALLA